MRILKFTPTVSTTAYTAGDVVGTKMALGQVDALLHSLAIADNGNQGPAGQILFFDGDPGSVPADNAAFTWPTGALAKLIGVVDAPTYKTVASEKIATVGALGITLKSNACYAVFVTSGTPTLTSTSDLTFKFGLETRQT